MGEIRADYEALCRYTNALVCALKHRDPHTNIHSQRVIALSNELGNACGLSALDLNMLKVSASLHDIGKIGIPDVILLKKGRLTPEEQTIMQSHAVQGEDIIRMIDVQHYDLIAKSVRHHHEYYDGSGYPDKIKGEIIPIFARIISVADSYDAITERRAYHNPRTHQQAIEIMSETEGEKFDPYIFSKFQSLIQNSEYRV